MISLLSVVAVVIVEYMEAVCLRGVRVLCIYLFFSQLGLPHTENGISCPQAGKRTSNHSEYSVRTTILFVSDLNLTGIIFPFSRRGTFQHEVNFYKYYFHVWV